MVRQKQVAYESAPPTPAPGSEPAGQVRLLVCIKRRGGWGREEGKRARWPVENLAVLCVCARARTHTHTHSLSLSPSLSLSKCWQAANGKDRTDELMQQEDDEMQVFLFVVKVVSSQVVCVMCYG